MTSASTSRVRRVASLHVKATRVRWPRFFNRKGILFDDQAENIDRFREWDKPEQCRQGILVGRWWKLDHSAPRHMVVADAWAWPAVVAHFRDEDRLMRSVWRARAYRIERPLSNTCFLTIPEHRYTPRRQELDEDALLPQDRGEAAGERTDAGASL